MPKRSVQFVMILISVACAFGHVQKYEDLEFYRTHSTLVLVPLDIPTDAEEVHLEHNSIGNLSRGSFSHLTGCITLDLSNNVINTVQDGAMIGLNNLRRLDLSYNRLRILNENMWDGLLSLVGLYLYGNSIEAIPSGCFRTLTNLETLSLNGNKLTEVRGDMWRGLKSLDALDLGGNPLQTILPNGFGNLPIIGRLSLFKTGIRSLDKNIFNSNDFPDSDGHPRKVKLVLNGNPLQCDHRLCWLKQAEEDGWITWFVAHYVGKPYMGIHSPECGNYPGSLWEDVSLDCPRKGTLKWVVVVSGSVIGGFAIATLLFLLICCKRRLNKRRSNKRSNRNRTDANSVGGVANPMSSVGATRDDFLCQTAIYESFSGSTKL